VSGAAGNRTSERNKRYSERRGGKDVEKRTKQAMQRAARRARRRQEKETSDVVSGAGQNVDKRTKQAMQRAAAQARRPQETETSDAASGAAGKTSTSERNERCSERRGGQVLEK
jgi:hypothetical protein